MPLGGGDYDLVNPGSDKRRTPSFNRAAEPRNELRSAARFDAQARGNVGGGLRQDQPAARLNPVQHLLGRASAPKVVGEKEGAAADGGWLRGVVYFESHSLEKATQRESASRAGVGVWGRGSDDSSEDQAPCKEGNSDEPASVQLLPDPWDRRGASRASLLASLSISISPWCTGRLPYVARSKARVAGSTAA